MTGRLLVIGGDGAGMAAASQARRRDPGLEIVALEKGRWTSYSACGIPYVVGGDVYGLDDLVVRTPDEFRAVRIDVRLEHEAVGIDLDACRVDVRNLAHGREFQLGFDMLHIATGAVPRRPDLPGLDLPHVYGVQTLADAARLLAAITTMSPKRVVVAGSGYIGLELAEALARRGASVTVLEAGPEVMPSLDPDMGGLVARAMRGIGITVHTGQPLVACSVGAAHTAAGELPADVVILGTGVGPNSTLGAEAGLETGVAGALVVDRQQRTSAEGVWAAGDCCQSTHLVSGQPVYQALGTVANKQGRVAGINMSGGYATFPGVAGTAVTRVCHLEIGRTGLSEREAAEAGFGFVSARIEGTTTSGYLPDAPPITTKLIAEHGSGRVLGAQVAGGAGAAKRIDVIATALAAGMTAEDVLGLDLGYAPPVGTVWDPVQVAARQVLSQLG
jgi:NADPH-dependent 2,4-dienoyl-CoA reductase/sulfur reductase-like enzyme